MATQADRIFVDDRGGASAIVAFVDRWIYVFMAALMTAVVLIGFIPDSIGKVAAVRAGARPPFPVAMHLHALLMGAWMLLLLSQTTLMATGRRAMHMQLGVLGMVLAPALVIVGAVLIPTNLRSFVAFAQGAPPEVQAQVEGFLHIMTNLALLQTRVAICFLALVGLGLWARKRDSGLHKRLMILATTVPLPAAFDRMTFLYHSMPESPTSAHLWPLLCVAPMFLWDLYRRRTIHRAYWIYAALLLPTAIVTNQLWDSPWWHAVAPGFLYL